MPRRDGSIVCACGSPMHVIAQEREPKAIFRDITSKCLARLAQLKRMPADAKLRCPWDANFSGCGEDCRCGGQKWVTASLLVAHYRLMAKRYDNEVSTLDEMILEEVSSRVPKHFGELYEDVSGRYGETNVRTLYRHLGALIERGRVLRVEVGENLYAYLQPGSKIAKDKRFILDFLRDRLSSSSFFHERAAAF